MSYIRNYSQGIIALIKRNENYEFNAIDSSYCVLEDYVNEIESGDFFLYIKESKLNFKLMRKDFLKAQSLKNSEIFDSYMIWQTPNIFIDFDDKFLANYYPDRLFEQMVPEDWNAIFVKDFEEFMKFIPEGLRYWG